MKKNYRLKLSLIFPIILFTSQAFAECESMTPLLGFETKTSPSINLITNENLFNSVSESQLRFTAPYFKASEILLGKIRKANSPFKSAMRPLYACYNSTNPSQGFSLSNIHGICPSNLNEHLLGYAWKSTRIQGKNHLGEIYSCNGKFSVNTSENIPAGCTNYIGFGFVGIYNGNDFDKYFIPAEYLSLKGDTSFDIKNKLQAIIGWQDQGKCNWLNRNNTATINLGSAKAALLSPQYTKTTILDLKSDMDRVRLGLSYLMGSGNVDSDQKPSKLRASKSCLFSNSDSIVGKTSSGWSMPEFDINDAFCNARNGGPFFDTLGNLIPGQHFVSRNSSNSALSFSSRASRETLTLSEEGIKFLFKGAADWSDDFKLFSNPNEKLHPSHNPTGKGPYFAKTFTASLSLNSYDALVLNYRHKLLQNIYSFHPVDTGVKTSNLSLCGKGDYTSSSIPNFADQVAILEGLAPGELLLLRNAIEVERKGEGVVAVDDDLKKIYFAVKCDSGEAKIFSQYSPFTTTHLRIGITGTYKKPFDPTKDGCLRQDDNTACSSNIIPGSWYDGLDQNGNKRRIKAGLPWGCPIDTNGKVSCFFALGIPFMNQQTDFAVPRGGTGVPGSGTPIKQISQLVLNVNTLELVNPTELNITNDYENFSGAINRASPPLKMPILEMGNAPNFKTDLRIMNPFKAIGTPASIENQDILWQIKREIFTKWKNSMVLPGLCPSMNYWGWFPLYQQAYSATKVAGIEKICQGQNIDNNEFLSRFSLDAINIGTEVHMLTNIELLIEDFKITGLRKN